MHRKKLNHNQMVKILKGKGITFNIINEIDAVKFLTDANYYYKLTSYRKNYIKSEENKYINLDFAYLVDLSSIDMQLRYHIMKMSLDIEHSIKTLLLKTITNNQNEDGYSILSDFKKFDTGNYNRTFNIFKKSEYLIDMYQKRGADIPVWVFIEIMDYGTLSKFISFYRTKYKADNFKQAELLLPYSKHLRNSAAHSNTLLVNIYGDSNFLKDENKMIRNPSTQVVGYGHSYGIKRDDLRYNKIHDLVCLFQLHKKYTSNAVYTSRNTEFRNLITRINRNNTYYSNNKVLSDFFSILENLNS